MTTILILNLVASLASAAWAGTALIQPALLSGSSGLGDGERFYVRMYAARAIPFGVAAGVLPLWSRGQAVAFILFTTAVVQIGDVAVGVGRKKRSMIVGATVGAIVHVLCGFMLLLA